MDGWVNDPELFILVDKIPHAWKDMRYTKKEIGSGQTIYHSEKDGYVSFLVYEKDDENGFCESGFDIILKDGTKTFLIGPWSSRSSVMMKNGFVHSMDVGLTDNEDVFNNNGVFYGASVTIPVVKKALKLINPELRIELVDANGEKHYRIPKRNL
jgi:hypothetical protein